MRILIVEDDLATQLFLKVVLEGFGRCDTVSDGAMAIQAYSDAVAKGQPFEVIFMDIMMPEMNGLVAIDRIREYESHHPHTVPKAVQVIVVTATDDSHDILHAYCSGNVFAYLKKPLFREHIMATMHKLLGASEVPL